MQRFLPLNRSGGAQGRLFALLSVHEKRAFRVVRMHEKVESRRRFARGASNIPPHDQQTSVISHNRVYGGKSKRARRAYSDLSRRLRERCPQFINRRV